MIELDKRIKEEIIIKNSTKEVNYQFPFATRDLDAVYENENNDIETKKSFGDDIFKILNCRAYNRYMGKTQVFFIGTRNDQICTRALHVQLVSYIARRISSMLGLNTSLAEAIALGHDLGHTPFGHDGERAMNKILNPHGKYFRHAVHSVKILKDILKLDISIQTLDGIMCHNGESIKYAYNYDDSKFKTIENFFEEYNRANVSSDFEKNLVPMTMEGWVVRISDVIAYVGKDIEDAITLKFISRDDIPQNVREILGNNNDEITNSLINDLVNNSFGKKTISFSPEVNEALVQLREFNYSRIYTTPLVKLDTYKIQEMFETMFEKYLNDLRNENKESSIYNFIAGREDLKQVEFEDIVVDYIAGMTDEFFEKEYKEFVVPNDKI